MADLKMVFGSENVNLIYETEYVDPIRMVRNLYLYLNYEKGLMEYSEVENSFIKFTFDNWNELWEDRCPVGKVKCIKIYLINALDYLKSIFDDDGNILEPFKSRLLSLDQFDLWDIGFFYMEEEDNIISKGVSPKIENFIHFLDKVIKEKVDLLRRTDD